VIINVNDQAKLNKITAFVRPITPSSTIIFSDSSGNSLAEQSSQNLGVWQQISFYSPMPISYQANGVWEVGEINIENSNSGVVISAMGINGSELSQWSRWRGNWMQEDLNSTKADLVIIAYGTNEAFNSNIDISATEQLWESSIEQIKKALPMAGILIIGAPESLKSTAGACGVRAPQLDNIQKMQQRVAIKEKTLYWSWQGALGGSCSMKKLMLEGLARKDGVHFTQKGYNFAADQLADELIKFANK
jgi:lysophospholipase L1-like esterase